MFVYRLKKYVVADIGPKKDVTLTKKASNVDVPVQLITSQATEPDPWRYGFTNLIDATEICYAQLSETSSFFQERRIGYLVCIFRFSCDNLGRGKIA